MAIKFSVLKEATDSRARLGVLETPHGKIQTPVLCLLVLRPQLKLLQIMS